jgi:oxygen-dependent protoporphyrinogen oxidase
MTVPRVAVVGGGIAGLAAALRLRECLPDAHLIVYESSLRLGGKLRTSAFAGRPMESGAETFLVRDPAGGDSAAVRLVHRIGLGAALVHPEPLPAALALDGAMHALPTGTLLGVPSDLSTLDGVAAVDPALDHDGGHPLLAPDEDVAVGALVRKRLGDQVVDRLVDPLLGGVYAGRADGLSLAATMPSLAAACREESTLVRAARQAVAASAAHGRLGGPIFATVQDGLSTLVNAVAAASGARLRLGQPVRELRRTVNGWLVDGETVDAVVLAVPARPAARLLTGTDPGAAAELGALDYASVALVTLALPAADLPALSGFLVPASEGRVVKAATFFTRKWAHHRRDDGLAIVRASVGRYGEEEVLRHADASLVAIVRADLAAVLGRALPEPAEATVTRWGGALPQYAPGHLDRVARARAALDPTLALAGAGYDGVGIPACIKSGETAAARIERGLGESPS